MECKTVEKAIPSFFENELEGKPLIGFLEHVAECEKCREELAMYYLSSEGLLRLEEGGGFDLDRELDDILDEKIHRIIVRRRLRWGLFLLEGVSLLAIVGILLYVLL